MRVLILCPEVPFPLHGGDHIRQYHLLKNAARHHEIDLLCFAQDEREMAGVEEMRKFCRLVEAIRYAPPGPLGKVRGLFGASPYYSHLYASASMKRLVAQFSAREKYDVAQFEHEFLAPYSRHVEGHSRATILTVQNLLSFKYQRDSEHSLGFLRRIHAARESQRWLKEENKRFPTFDCLLTPSMKNQDLLRERFANTRIEVVENGADTHGIMPTEGDDGHTLCFVGSMSYRPNIDAVKFFLDKIYSLISERVPHVQLDVVGNNPPAWLQREASENRKIQVTGYVESVAPYLQKAAVMIVPLLTGGGTRLKILEAFAAGKAVVSTSVGAEGIDCQSGKDIMLADDPKTFADAVCDLLERPERRSQLGASARRLVEERYSWDALATKLERIWEEVVADTARL